MSIRENFKDFMKEAMKSKDDIGLSTIRLIMAALKDRDIAARSKGIEAIEEKDILSLLQTMIKQRKESASTYRDAGREELADREETEIKVIQRFLPAQLSEDEVRAALDKIIEETGAASIKDMGQVMGLLKSRFAGQIDMGKAGGLVKQKLG